MWQMIKENLKTKVKHCCGTYTSLKQGLQYAPEVLDDNFDELDVGIDEKDDLIGDFMQAGGKMAVVCKGFQFYLTKRIKDGYGNQIAEPSGCIRIGGKAVWRRGDDIRIVEVTGIDSPQRIEVVSLDGYAVGGAVPVTELKYTA